VRAISAIFFAGKITTPISEASTAFYATSSIPRRLRKAKIQAELGQRAVNGSSGGVADTLDEAKAAFRAAGELLGSLWLNPKLLDDRPPLLGIGFP
jgi:hypothetical protein